MTNRALRVLFVCVHNAGRSQMAAALANLLSEGTLLAESAGTEPASRAHPTVVEAMREKGLDLSQNRPRLLTQGMLDEADRVITMGCAVEEVCPGALVPAEDWGLEDPADRPLEQVRAIRDQIEARVRQLVAEAQALQRTAGV